MSALAILRSEALYIYYSDQPAPIGGTLPKIAVADMEVVSEEELTASIAKLVPSAQHALIPTVLVLSDELCFIQPFKGENKEEAEKILVSLTPFAHVATMSVNFGDQKYFIGTNQDYYEAVSRALIARGHQVAFVIPWSVLVRSGVTKGELDMVTVKHTFDNLTSLRSSVFPLLTEYRQKQESETSSAKKVPPKLPIGWVLFGVGALAYVFVMYWFFIRSG